LKISEKAKNEDPVASIITPKSGAVIKHKDKKITSGKS